MPLERSARWFALFVLGCGSSPLSPAAAPEPVSASAASPARAQTATYPTPYTAEQIRDATRPGRAYTWRVELSGRAAFERTVTFTRVDAEGAELVSDGVAERMTWEDLRLHAAFPRWMVTTREETVTVPAGTYDCVVYVIDDRAAGETSTFYFAKTMPGAPVLFFSDKGGARSMTNTLVRYSPGTGG